jgi:signal transduction histidine kinase
MFGFFIKRDLRKMSRKLGKIAEGDTNTRLTTDTFDKDVAALAESVNAMLERNRHDVFEKVRADAALKRAVTNISHDLRTPLTAAMGYLQMLKSTEIDDETRARYLEIIQGRLEALSALMNSLFEFSCVIEGSIEVTATKVNICNVLRDVLSDSHTELQNKGFSVDINIPDTPKMCICDEDAVRRVIHNLVKNVYVHGREYLRVRLVGGVIEIANKADGLAELDTDGIFERFYTTDASRTSKNTGLGLAIVKELVERMGGHISAEVEGDLLVMRVSFRE